MEEFLRVCLAGFVFAMAVGLALIAIIATMAYTGWLSVILVPAILGIATGVVHVVFEGMVR